MLITVVSFLLSFVGIPVLIHEFNVWRYGGSVFLGSLLAWLICGLIMIGIFLSRFRKTSKLLVRAGEGEKKALEAMSTHRDDEVYQWQGAAALYHIMLAKAETGVTAEDIFQLGGWDHLLTALKTFPDSKEVAIWVFSAMTFLAKVDAVKKQVGDEGGLNTIICTMEKCLEAGKQCEIKETEDARATAEMYLNTQKRGCMALGQIVDGQPKLQTAAVDEGGLDVVLECMQWYRDHGELQQWALWAILQLTFEHPANRVYLLKKGGMRLVLDSLKNHAQARKVQCQGLGVVMSSFQLADGIDTSLVCKLAMNDGLEKIAQEAKERFPSDVYIIQVCDQLLSICNEIKLHIQYSSSPAAPIIDQNDSEQIEKLKSDLVSAYS
mmetsp:Transcript_22105/g.28628  ORF Transcript_22105/g.28628 Transcript_22105/m.28628 type:complete len:380 (-) Transcript_22105:110-1249(-)